MINILQDPGSIERLVDPDYYFNYLEKRHEFDMSKKVGVARHGLSPGHGCTSVMLWLVCLLGF